MRRDMLFVSLGVIATSFFMYTNYYKANTTYRKFDISPSVYKHEIAPVDIRSIHTKMAVTTPEKSISYKPGFKVSVDLPSGEDEYGIETYMELPLETDGKTAKTDSLYKDIEEDIAIQNLKFVKYIKFQCTSLRNPEREEVRVGGFRFFQGNTLASEKPIVLWNPHTDKRENYTEGAWSDSDQQTVIFCFSEPIITNRYEIKSSDDLVDFDPVNWKIDGSINGSFWSTLDDRTSVVTAFPKERGRGMMYTMNRL